MAEFAKSDIFFFITGGSVIIITIVVLIALYYLVKILRDVEDITESIRGEANHIVDDVSFIRRNLEGIGKNIRKKFNKVTSKNKKKKSSKK
jgi:hypothetical protein